MEDKYINTGANSSAEIAMRPFNTQVWPRRLDTIGDVYSYKQGEPFDYALLAGKALPDARVIYSEVARELKGMPLAQITGEHLALGAWNMEFLTWAKATYFLDSYKEVVLRHHLLAVEEANTPGLATLARACGYRFFISTVNSRGQAVGFLVHPRLRVLRRVEYLDVADVRHVPDLRPALRLDLYDPLGDVSFSVVVVHLKSMLGGPEATSKIRIEQLSKLIHCLGTATDCLLVLGDFNCYLNDTSDTRPLTGDGYVLQNRLDQSATHHLGRRLDGLFHKNMPPTMRLSSYHIHNFWHNRLIGCSLSDHGLLTWQLGSHPRSARRATLARAWISGRLDIEFKDA